jgi:hypothetical protein
LAQDIHSTRPMIVYYITLSFVKQGSKAFYPFPSFMIGVKKADKSIGFSKLPPWAKT